MTNTFEQMLTGGHPNSLGRTIEVVELVLNDPDRFEELFTCYHSADEVVRLRTSNAIKRVEKGRHALLIPYIDRLLDEIGALDQSSAQWTLAQLFEAMKTDMSDSQRTRAVEIMKQNLTNRTDWIVLNNTIETLANWAQDDPDLKIWLMPHLDRLSIDPRKSVATRARKKQAILNTLP